MPGLLEKLSEVFDAAWEDLIFDPATNLPTVMEIDNIDARWLAQQLPLLGFTSDISLPASTEELRRIGINAVAFWNKKPTEEAMVELAIRMVTGNRFRAANWFDFRMQADKTVITEELQNLDPSAISFPTAKVTGEELNLSGLGGGLFSIDDLGALFKGATEYGWLLVDEGANLGIYEIDFLNVGTDGGEIVGAFPSVPDTNLDWTLLGFAGEYTTEVRLVDQGIGTIKYRDLIAAFTVGQKVYGEDSGATGIITADDGVTLSLKKINGRFLANERLQDPLGGDATSEGELAGVLNRALLRILMDLARPFGERIDVVYINFLDQFLQPFDLDQWTLSDVDLVSVPSPGGTAVILETARVTDADPYLDDLGDAIIAWKYDVDDAAAIVEFAFWITDASNHYFVRVDYAAKNLELYKKVATVDTQIGGTISLPVLKENVLDVVRVEVLAEGADTRIRVHLAGDLRLDEVDSPSAFTSGRVGAFANTKALNLKTVEVNEIPTEIDRVGPNP
jgi:hypothetical protein